MQLFCIPASNGEKMSTYNGWHDKGLEEEAASAVFVALKDEEVSICGHLSSNGPVDNHNTQLLNVIS